MKSKKPRILGGLGDVNFGKQYRQGNRVYDSEACAMALNSQPVGNWGVLISLFNQSEKRKK